MRITGMLVDACLWKTLTSFHNQKTGYATETICEQIYFLLRNCGIMISKVEVATNSPGEYYSSLSSYSFSGRDCQSLFQVIFQILEMIFPDAARQKDEDTQQQYEKWTALWQFYIEQIRALLNTRCCLSASNFEDTNGVFESAEAARLQRAQKADKLETNMRIFIEMYVDCYKATTHLYPHIYWYHVPHQLRNRRIDPIDAQMQSVEGNNKKNKTIQLRTTNSQIQHKQTQQVRGHTKANGNSVPGYNRMGGDTRTVQILKKSVVGHKLHKDGMNPSQKNKQQMALTQRFAKEAAQIRLQQKLATY